MEAAHSKWSASKFARVEACPGSIVLEAAAPRKTSVYAAEGTAAHQVLEWCLQTGTPAAGFVGRVIEVDGFTFEVDDDMAEHVQSVVDNVRELAGADGVVMSERRVFYAQYLDVNEQEAWGTSDVIIAVGNKLIVGDLKYGKGKAVRAERNSQAMLYGLGALVEFQGIAGDFDEVELVIWQPRISREPSRWTIGVADLEAWGREDARRAVQRAQNAERMMGSGAAEWETVYLNPGEDQCQFCSAKAQCPALYREVSQTVSRAPATAAEFEAVTDPATFDDAKLARAMGAVDLIEGWCKDVRAEVERRLLAGTPVAGFKLVEGKLGNRAWSNAKDVEEVLKGMRLRDDEMYDRKLISPTTAEKLLAKESPRRWAKLQPMITRAPGKTSVAPVSDPRPALEVKPAADDFDVVESIDDLA